MENGESTREAARRETAEEAGARVSTGELFVLANLPYANQVYLLYLAQLEGERFQAGQESSDVRLFDKHAIPWDNIAFHTVKLALGWYYEDLEKGRFSLHEIDF